MKFRPETELAIPFKRSKKTNLAFSKERCFEFCLKPFWMDHKTEMARKKKATASFLPETSPSITIVFQIIEVVRGKVSLVVHGLRSHNQNC